MSSIVAWFRYQLERWVLRGSLALILLLVSLLSTIAAIGGTVAYFLPGHHFPSLEAAFWWATLRISDPGYLSDDFPDVGTRALSMFLSVMGMTVTVGGVVAIVTQGMNRRLQSLAAATTPVPFTGHIVLIGLTDRTAKILNILLEDDPAKIVVLVNEINRDTTRLVQNAARGRHRNRVVLRSGKSQRADELKRTRCSRAKTVIFPATAGAVAGDPEAGPRLLMSLTALRTLIAQEDPTRPPDVVVELVDRSLMGLVRSTLPEARVLASDRIVARTLRLSLQGKGLSEFAFDLAVPRFGHELSFTEEHRFEGLRLSEIDARTTGARVLGLLTMNPPRLSVDWDTRVDARAPLLVFGAQRPTFYPERQFEPIALSRAKKQAERIDLGAKKQRILVLGWNEVAPDFVQELTNEPDGRYEVDFLSTVPRGERDREILEVNEAGRVAVRHFEEDPMNVGESTSIDLGTYSRFLILADRRVPPETADERTLAVILSLERRRGDFPKDSTIAVELLAEENAGLAPGTETVITPLLSANLLCTLASNAHAPALLLALSHQATFFSRLVVVPKDLARDEPLLAAAVRSAGYALLHVLPDDGSRHHQRVIICETPAGAA